MTVMPPEWEAHERTWMAWPPEGPTTGDLDSAGLERTREAWAEVANAIVRYEPVTMVVSPADEDSARRLLKDAVGIVTAQLDDSWMRDIGPTFVRVDGGGLAAVDWIFNGWGAQEWAEWGNDARIAALVAEAGGVPVLSSEMVNEGGAIHVDGRGAVLVTRTVQLDPGRNPEWSASEVESELVRLLGADRVVWLDRGLTRDYKEFGTRGHVDMIASFAGPDAIVFHDQRDSRHPDFHVSQELRATLENAFPDRTVIGLVAPTVLEDDHGWVDYSYVNHYVCKGAVIACGFNDPNDEVAAKVLAECYPDREIVTVDARAIFARGGGIHCITQQQPL